MSKGGTFTAKKRRRFTAEFKKRVALEALREQNTVQAIATRYEIHTNQVGAWKRQAVEDLDEVFTGPASKRGREQEAAVSAKRLLASGRDPYLQAQSPRDAHDGGECRVAATLTTGSYPMPKINCWLQQAGTVSACRRPKTRVTCALRLTQVVESAGDLRVEAEFKAEVRAANMRTIIERARLDPGRFAVRLRGKGP